MSPKIASRDAEEKSREDSNDNAAETKIRLASAQKSVMDVSEHEAEKYRQIDQSDAGKKAEFYDAATKSWVEGTFRRGLKYQDKIEVYIADIPGTGVETFVQGRIANSAK